MVQTLLLVTFIFLSTSCQKANQPQIEDEPIDSIAPTIISSPGLQPYLTTTTDIKLIFSESMDSDSLTIDGVMADLSTVSWSKKQLENDTLIISPTVSWNNGEGQDLVIDANDLAGNALATFTLNPVFIENIVYVSANLGADGNPGTRLLPKKSLGLTIEGITVAPTAILVAEGAHHVDFQSGDYFNIMSNMVVQGGYSEDFSNFNPLVYLSTIIDDSSEIIVKKAFVINDMVENFTLQNMTVDIQYGAPGSFAIENNSAGTINSLSNQIFGGAITNRNNGTVVIRQNKIRGSSRTGAHTCPMIDNRSGATLDMENSEFEGCNTAETFLTSIANSGQARIVNNRIYGGEAERAVFAVSNSGTIDQFEGNELNGGVVRDNTGSFINTVQTEGLRNGGTISSFKNNTVFGGQGGIFAMGINNFGQISADANRIYGGGTVRNYTYAILSTGNTVLTNNTIFTNSPDHLTQPGQGLRFGLNANGTPTLVARNNIFYTDTMIGFGAIELGNNAFSSRIENNIIHVSGSNDGIYISNSLMGSEQIIQNNTIFLNDEFSVAIRNNQSTQLQLDNNIFARSVPSDTACIRFSPTSSINILSFNNNDFFGCNTILQDNGIDINDFSTPAITLLDTNQYTLGGLNNINIEPIFNDSAGPDNNIYTPADNDPRLSSTNDDSLLTGGLDLSGSGASLTDFTDQTPRTGDGVTGWSIGAFELDL